MLVSVLGGRLSDEPNLQDEVRVGGNVAGETTGQGVSTEVPTKLERVILG